MTQLRIITPNVEKPRKAMLKSYYALCKGLEMTTTEVTKTIRYYAKREDIPFKQAFEEMEYIANDILLTLAWKEIVSNEGTEN